MKLSELRKKLARPKNRSQPKPHNTRAHYECTCDTQAFGYTGPHHARTCGGYRAEYECTCPERWKRQSQWKAMHGEKYKHTDDCFYEQMSRRATTANGLQVTR